MIKNNLNKKNMSKKKEWKNKCQVKLKLLSADDKKNKNAVSVFC